MNQAQPANNFSCSQCSKSLDDYAITCPGCGLDLKANDPRSAAVLAKSINRKEQSIFFYVSPFKLVVMSIATCGIYELMWFYKNWSYVKEHSGKTHFVLLEAIFGHISYFWLLKEMGKAGDAQGVKYSFSPLILAIAYFLVSMCCRIPFPGGLIGFLAVLALVPAQKYVNALNTASPTPINDRFTPLNWVAIVIFSIIQFFAILGFLHK